MFISAIGDVIGEVAAGHILFLPTFFTVVGSLIGAPIGSRISPRVHVKYLRYARVVLMVATAIKIWLSIFE